MYNLNALGQSGPLPATLIASWPTGRVFVTVLMCLALMTISQRLVGAQTIGTGAIQGTSLTHTGVSFIGSSV